MGYQAPLAGKGAMGVNLFYNEYSDLFIFPTKVSPTQIVSMPENGGDAWGVGGELDLSVQVTDQLSLFANYSYQQTTDKDDNPTTLTVNEKDRARRDVPRHKVNAGVRIKFNHGISVNLRLHWVDETQRLITDLGGNEFQGKTDPYTIVNGGVGYSFWRGKAEASLNVFNIFNDRHFEYPTGNNLAGINLPERSSEPVGRKLAFKVSCRF
jgi:outer membrane receptor protein involved in Fe transport